MTDVVVRIDLEGPESEAKLFEAVNQFAADRAEQSDAPQECEDAPQIMIKTVPDGQFFKKAVIFQDETDARAFMFYWHQAAAVA